MGGKAALESLIRLGCSNRCPVLEAVAIMGSIAGMGFSKQRAVPVNNVVEIIFCNNIELRGPPQIPMGLGDEDALLRCEPVSGFLIVQALLDIVVDLSLAELDQHPVGVEREQRFGQIVEVEGANILDDGGWRRDRLSRLCLCRA